MKGHREHHRGYDPEAFLRTGQAVRTDMVITLLGQEQFRVKSQEGSHIKLEREGTGEVFIIPKDTTNPEYQYQAAHICLRIREEKRRAAEAEQATMRAKFAAAAPAHAELHNVRDHLREDVEAIGIAEYPGCVILRSKTLRSAGLITREKLTEPELRRVFAELRSKENDIAQLLMDTKDKYKVSLVQNKPEDPIQLIQYDYSIAATLPDYDGINTTTASDMVNALTAYIEHRDRTLAKNTRESLTTMQEQGIAVPEKQEDGRIKWTITRPHALTQEKKQFTITTSEEFRVDPRTHYALQDAYFQHDIGGDGDNHYGGKILHNLYGFDVRRPREGKNPGPKLVATHPYFPECSFEMPVPSDIPRLEKLWMKRVAAPTDDERIAFDLALLEAYDTQMACSKAINDALAVYIPLSVANGNRFNELDGHTMRLQGAELHIDPPNAKPGEIMTLTYTHPSFEQPVRVHCLRLQNREDSQVKYKVGDVAKGTKLTPQKVFHVITDPADMDKWEETLISRKVSDEPKPGKIGELPSVIRDLQL